MAMEYALLIAQLLRGTNIVIRQMGKPQRNLFDALA